MEGFKQGMLWFAIRNIFRSVLECLLTELRQKPAHKKVGGLLLGHKLLGADFD